MVGVAIWVRHFGRVPSLTLMLLPDASSDYFDAGFDDELIHEVRHAANPRARRRRYAFAVRCVSTAWSLRCRWQTGSIAFWGTSQYQRHQAMKQWSGLKANATG